MGSLKPKEDFTYGTVQVSGSISDVPGVIPNPLSDDIAHIRRVTPEEAEDPVGGIIDLHALYMQGGTVCLTEFRENAV